MHIQHIYPLILSKINTTYLHTSKGNFNFDLICGERKKGTFWKFWESQIIICFIIIDFFSSSFEVIYLEFCGFSTGSGSRIECRKWYVNWLRNGEEIDVRSFDR
jgi:hypothetical protein